MVTAGRSPRMMAQKTQVAGISREPTAAPLTPGTRPSRRPGLPAFFVPNDPSSCPAGRLYRLPRRTRLGQQADPPGLHRCGPQRRKSSALSLGYWLSVVFWPAAVIWRPCCVTLMLWIVTPAGSFGMLKLKFARLPRTSAGIPLKLVTLTLIWFDPDLVTWAVAVSLSGPRL